MATALATPAGADSKDTSAEQREVRRKQAQKAAEVKALKASDAELEKALDAANAHVRSEQAAAARARADADRAAAAMQAAQIAEGRAERELADLRDQVRELAVESYMRGDLPASVQADGAGSITEVARAQAFIDTVVGKRADLTDKLKAALEDLASQRARADEARKAALARRRQQEAKLEDSKDAQNRQKTLAGAADARLEQALGEMAFLDAHAKDLAERRRRELAAVASKAGSGASSRGSTRQAGTPSLRTVLGITVASDIADNLERLLDASDGAGLSLSGQGYRSSDGQVAARRSNCGSSDYDVYEKPASQCSPPTARPGSSMHEQGRAVDFTNNGKIISSHSDPAWQWLKGNAGSYGFYNLPSEPWHWSTNGN